MKGLLTKFGCIIPDYTEININGLSVYREELSDIVWQGEAVLF